MLGLLVQGHGRWREIGISETAARNTDLAGDALPPDRRAAIWAEVVSQFQAHIAIVASICLGFTFDPHVFEWKPCADMDRRPRPPLAAPAAAHDHRIGIGLLGPNGGLGQDSPDRANTDHSRDLQPARNWQRPYPR